MCHCHTGIGTIIIAPRGVNRTGYKYPREQLSCHHNTRVTLIIFEENIVFGLVGLDQIVFEQKSITLACYDNVFYIYNLSNQLACFSIGVLLLEVATHPPSQILCLTHINNLPLGVVVLVATRREREGGKDLFYLFEGHKSWRRLFCFTWNKKQLIIYHRVPKAR